MSTPILSICIATYNRAKYIGQTLDSIIPQLSDSVELLVVDGASTDDTENVVREYVNTYPKIRYFRLPVKGGVDQDYSKAVELAAGEYCWLFTDDDVIKPGTIDRILFFIKHNQYSLIILNASLNSLDLKSTYINNILNMCNDEEYTPLREDQNEFFKKMANHLSFIGCVVIRRKLWEERNKEDYYGTEFIHVGVIFQKPMPEKILVIAEPYISIRMNNSQWSSRALKIWLNNWPKLIWSFDQYSEKARRCLCPKYPSMQLWRLLYYRAMASYSVEEYYKFIMPYSNHAWSRLLAKGIAIIPGLLANSFLITYSIIRGRKWMLVDLKSSAYYFGNKNNNISN